MTVRPADQALGAYLTSLRLSAGLDLAVLARRVSLSAAQVNELESGRASLFYNDNIRRQAARKIILHLGGDLSHLSVDLPAAVPKDVPTVESVTAPAPSALASTQPVRRRPSDFDAPPAAAPTASQPTAVSPPLNWVAGLALITVLVSLGVGVARWSASAGQSAQAKTLPAESPAVVVRPEPVAPAPLPAEAKAIEVAAAALPDAPATVEAGGGKEVDKTDKADRGSATCAWQPGDVPVYQPALARKPGDMVYIVSLVSQVLCVADASGKPQVQKLEAGQAQSFYGQPPWQVASNQLQQTQLYFQGAKVRLPAQAQDRVQLVELR